MFLFTLGVLTLTLFLVFLAYILEKKRRFQSISHIPGPKGLPLLGNALDLGQKPTDILPNITKFLEKYGKIVQLWIGPVRPFLFISDVQLIEFILSSSRHIDKSKDYTFLHDWLQDGLLVSKGEKWRQRRKTLTPTFHFKILEDFVDVFNSAGDILIKKLQAGVDKDHINIFPYITLYTLDVICETAMGTSINAQENKDSEYVQAVRDACNVLIERTFSAWKQFDFCFQFSNSYKVQKKSLKILHSFTDSVIKRRKEELKEELLNDSPTTEDATGVRRRYAFLDLLLKAKARGELLTDNDVREEVDTFMFEGHDTTSSAISFALYEIANHPEVQEKLLAEQKEIFEDDMFRPITSRDMANMKYMEYVIKETLRIYPSVPFYARELKEDVNYNGTILPAGLTLTMLVYHLHKDPELFPEPEKFIPERFSPEKNIRSNAYAYVPFSAGLRNCIGQKFAMSEMKATLSKILRNFELSNAEQPLLLSAEVVLKSETGICIRMKKRNL